MARIALTLNSYLQASHLERNKDEEVRKEEENARAMDMVNDDGPSGLILLLVCQPELVWQQVVSRSSGQVYYANAALGVSRWERPSVPGYKRGIAASAPHPVSSSAAVAQSHFTSYERRQGHSNARSERGMRLRDERYRRALRESCAVLP